MLEHLHEHISQEMRATSTTDTVFVVSAVIFNFVMLGINWGVASADEWDPRVIVLVITLALSVMVNAVAIVALLTGRATRQKLLHGLMKMYEDADVSQYYDESLLTNYMRRYVLFISITGLLGLMAILVPLVVLATT